MECKHCACCKLHAAHWWTGLCAKCENERLYGMRCPARAADEKER
jgi:hypothetical protein